MEEYVSMGLSLLDNENCILKDFPKLYGECLISDVVNYFVSNNIPRAVIVDNKERLLGIIDSADLLVIMAQGQDKINKLKAKDYTRKPEIVVREKAGIQYNIRLIVERGLVGAIVIDDEGKFCGVIDLNAVSKSLRTVLAVIDEFVSRIIESVYNGIVSINAHGNIVFFNPSAEKILSLKAEDVMGKHILNFFPECHIFEVLQKQRPKYDVRLSFGNINVLADFKPIIAEGKVLGAVAIFKDVTELEAVSDRLTIKEKLMATLEAVVENSYEGMLVIDENERVILINQFFLDILGLQSEEVIGRHVHEISPNSRLPETFHTGIPEFGATMRIGERDFMVMRVPIQQDGKIIGALGKTLFKNMEVAKLFAKKVMRLEEDLKYYKGEFHKFHTAKYSLYDIIGESEAMTAAKALAARAARTSSTVLLLGESGTGKEIFAQAIHSSSSRKAGPMIRVNCAALPENLLESELFGYTEGAFTGAKKGGKPGKFELANKGTIFLDEIGDMSSGMQSKLLRVIQEREVERIGGTKPIKIDVRLISATNRDLHHMVMERKFRLDLYYRLNVLTIELPPLRKREKDLGKLVDVLIKRLNQKLGTYIEGVAPETLDIFERYKWPGNIRELENTLERSMIIADESWIYPKHLTPSIINTGRQEESVKYYDKTLDQALIDAERDIIKAALEQAGGNKVQAARLLGIHRSALYRKLARHDFLGVSNV